jgi:hypothetical protein
MLSLEFCFKGSKPEEILVSTAVEHLVQIFDVCGLMHFRLLQTAAHSNL